MKKRLATAVSLTFGLLLAMLFLTMAPADRVQAATYYQTSDAQLISGKIYGDTIGGYYFYWAYTNKGKGKYIAYSKSYKASGATVIYTQKSGENLSPKVVTNGTWVYFVVHSLSTNKGTVYAYNLSTKKTQKIYTSTKLYSIDANYGNYLYFTKTSDALSGIDWNTKYYLYRYDKKKKTESRVMATYHCTSSYGRYLVGQAAASGDNYKLKSYDAATGKTYSLGTGYSPVAANGYVYYAYEYLYGRRLYDNIYKIKFTGGSKTKIIGDQYGDMMLARTCAFNYGSTPKKITYSTGKSVNY